jgi:phenylpropionate dioxygenase-like ring-hydroxylating dioxygenase large terminal subunit
VTLGLEQRERWFPIIRGEELVPRHIAHAQLLGQELALWRDDAGRANAWENRCPHRGVRLSIGTNYGSELRCRYHGWRFASGTGQCAYIPAHPTLNPPASARVRTFAAAERYGYLWVSLAQAPPPPYEEGLEDHQITTLRSLFVEAPAGEVNAAWEELKPPDVQYVRWLQPVDDFRTMLHAAVLDAPLTGDRLAMLRLQHSVMVRIRERAESRHAGSR